MSWRVTLLLGAVALTGATVVGQPGRGPRGGAGGGPRRGFAGPMDYGEITDLNPQRGYIQITSGLTGSDQVVVVTETTEILRDEAISAADLELGESVVVTGLALEVEASQIRVSAPREESEEETPPAEAVGGASVEETEEPGGQGAEETAPSPEETTPPEEARPSGEGAPAEGGPEGNPDEGADEGGVGAEGGAEAGPSPEERLSRAGARLSGVVVGKDPLRVEVWPGFVVRVCVADDAEVTRPTPVDFSVLTVGTQIVARGERDTFGLLEADVVRVGGSPMEMVGQMMPGFMGARRGPGGGFRRGLGMGGGGMMLPRRRPEAGENPENG